MTLWATRIVPKIWPPGIYSNPSLVMAHLQAIPILSQMEDTPVQVSHLGVVGAISEQGPRPDFNNGSGLIQIVAAF